MAGIQSVSISTAQSLISVSPQNQDQQPLGPFANLDLTSAQRTQLRSIFTAAKANGTSRSQVQQQVNAVLTPAQQQALKSDQTAFTAGGHQHRHHHSATDATSSDASAAGDLLATSGGGASASSSGVASPASAATKSTAASSAADSVILSIVANLQNQSAAAGSTLINTLRQELTSAQKASTGNPGSATAQATTQTENLDLTVA
jgi:hypothetical protein